MQKVAGEEHVADILPKNVKSEVLEKHMADMGLTTTTGREMDDDLTGADQQAVSQCNEE